MTQFHCFQESKNHPCLNENRVFSEVFLMNFDENFPISGKTLTSMTLVVVKILKKHQMCLNVKSLFKSENAKILATGGADFDLSRAC